MYCGVVSAQVKTTGCPVDTHGVLLDTDGDGVADCFDKEKLTKQECFPVDSNGIGTCPEPACCYHGIVDDFSCYLSFFPSLHFDNTTLLSQLQKNRLDTLCSDMIKNPYCVVIVKAYYKEAEKSTRITAQKRVENIINYITIDNGISAERVKTIIQPGTYIDYINIAPATR